MKRQLRLVCLYLLAILARPFAQRPAASVASVLYIKPDHLGDLLLATPVLARLRQQLATARITALVGPWSQVVLQRNPDVDTLLICPFPGFARGVKDRPGTKQALAPLRALSSFAAGLSSLTKPYLLLFHYARLLRAGYYDLAIVGRDDHWWGAALALLAGVPRRVGYAVPECRPFLSLALPWDPRTHVTVQGLELVEAATNDRQPPSNAIPKPQVSDLKQQISTRFDPSEADINWADEWIGSQGLAAHQRLVIIHPGTGGPAKLWFPERWAAVADALQSARAQLVLTGGPDEAALVAEIKDHMRAPVLTLAGQTTVGQLAALLRRAALVLGVDSGPLHLAAAQGIPTLHLYGPGDDRRFGPWGDHERHVVVREELWCSPCGVFSACPRGLARPECMDRIGVELVVARALGMLATVPAAELRISA
jgi:heptosyltransferase-2/heptosyltransferase-3